MSKLTTSHTTDSGWVISHDESGTTYAEKNDTRFQVVPDGILVVWNHAHAPFVQLDIDALIEVMGIAGLRDGGLAADLGDARTETYSFTAQATLRLGTPADFPKDAKLEATPNAIVDVKQIVLNVPARDFFTITRVLVGETIVFAGELDAYELTLDGLVTGGQPFAVGRMTPGDTVRVEGLYLGTVPKDFEEGKPYWLAASFRGAAESARFEVAATDDHWARSADHAPEPRPLTTDEKVVLEIQLETMPDRQAAKALTDVKET